MAHATLPDESIVRDTRVLIVDEHGVEGQLRMLDIAVADRIPVVGSFASGHGDSFNELLTRTEYLILPLDWALTLTGLKRKDSVRCIISLMHNKRRMVCLVNSTLGCWWAVNGEPIYPQKSYLHSLPKTSNAILEDDFRAVFQGAFAALLSNEAAANMAMAERIDIACATASIYCSQRRFATLTEVMQLIISARSGTT